MLELGVVLSPAAQGFYVLLLVFRCSVLDWDWGLRI